MDIQEQDLSSTVDRLLQSGQSSNPSGIKGPWIGQNISFRRMLYHHCFEIPYSGSLLILGLGS